MTAEVEHVPRLGSLLVTYSFENYDDYGLRAVVPRAVPLDPPFTPTTLAYKVQVKNFRLSKGAEGPSVAQVPSEVEEIEFEAPHSPQTEVRIAGNRFLQFGSFAASAARREDVVLGRNTVELVLTHAGSGEKLSYYVTVERKRRARFWTKCCQFSVAATAVVFGSLFIVRKLAPPNAPVLAETHPKPARDVTAPLRDGAEPLV